MFFLCYLNVLGDDKSKYVTVRGLWNTVMMGNVMCVL